jgi:hypothetical protein
MNRPQLKNAWATKSPENTPLNPSNERVQRLYGAYGLVWQGNELRLGKRKLLATLEPDAEYRGMWRVRLPSGRVTDMVNLSRAKDYACAAAVRLFDLKVAS